MVISKLPMKWINLQVKKNYLSLYIDLQVDRTLKKIFKVLKNFDRNFILKFSKKSSINLSFLLFFICGQLYFSTTATANFSSKSSIKDVCIEIKTSTSQISVGDSLSLFCTVTVPGGVKAGEPYLKGKSPFFDIEKQWEEKETFQRKVRSTSDSGISTEHYGFLLYVFSPDTLRAGPFIVDYVTDDGRSETAISDIIVLPITGIVENTESLPLPNRDPMIIASKLISIWLLILIISLIIITALAILYYFYRKKTSLKPIPGKPIDEIGEFIRIRNMKLYESGRLKELYILLSAAMRGFIQRNMKFDALYETTEEIEKQLFKTSSDTGIIRERDIYNNKEYQKSLRSMSEILEESDMVKFAKFVPPAELSSSVIDRSIEPVKAVLDDIARKKEEKVSAPAESETETI